MENKLAIDRKGTIPKTEGANLLFNLISYTVVTVAAILCLLPFEILISGSFTDENAIALHGYGILPSKFSPGSLSRVVQVPGSDHTGIRRFHLHYGGRDDRRTIRDVDDGLRDEPQGFQVPEQACVLLLLHDVVQRRHSVDLYFLREVSAVEKRHARLAILPLLINVFYLIVMRTFIGSIPDSISESAKIDGAGDFTIFMKLILPLTKPGLATIGLFYALDYWNDWYNAMLYITDVNKYPLQYLLFSTLQSAEAISRISKMASVAAISVPTLSLKLAMAVIATGPIILVYPSVQKYFVKGLTVGAIKG